MSIARDRTRRLLMPILALAMVLTPTGRAAALPADVPLVLWVWEGPTPELIETVVADGFDVVYLHVLPGSASDPAVERFVEAARQASVDVYAMSGVPGWAQEPAPFFAWLDEVIESGLFEGIVIDIEPYLLADWGNPKRRASLLDDYLNVLDTARFRAGALPVVATVPFWWDDPRYQVRRGSLLIEDVLTRSDAIAVMAYRDRVETDDGIAALTSDEIRLAADLGKQAVVTLQTGTDSLAKLTFFEEGREALNEAAVALAERWTVGRGFGGVAIHSFRPYLALAP